MIRTQIQLTEEQMAGLRLLAAQKKMSVARIIRASVEEMLKSSRIVDIAERRRRAIAAIGCFRSDTGDLSTDHDRHFAEAIVAADASPAVTKNQQP